MIMSKIVWLQSVYTIQSIWFGDVRPKRHTVLGVNNGISWLSFDSYSRLIQFPWSWIFGGNFRSGMCTVFGIFSFWFNAIATSDTHQTPHYKYLCWRKEFLHCSISEWNEDWHVKCVRCELLCERIHYSHAKFGRGSKWRRATDEEKKTEWQKNVSTDCSEINRRRERRRSNQVYLNRRSFGTPIRRFGFSELAERANAQTAKSERSTADAKRWVHKQAKNVNNARLGLEERAKKKKTNKKTRNIKTAAKKWKTGKSAFAGVCNVRVCDCERKKTKRKRAGKPTKIVPTVEVSIDMPRYRIVNQIV